MPEMLPAAATVMAPPEVVINPSVKNKVLFTVNGFVKSTLPAVLNISKL